MRQANVPRHLTAEWIADNPMRAVEEIERLRPFEKAWVAIEETFATYKGMSISIKAQKALHEAQRYTRRVIA